MTRARKRIAVVGAGVSGLGAAWALRNTADVTLYESAPRLGGHAWTVDVDYDGTRLPVDIGFICFNRPNYPNLTAMLDALGVRTNATDMSFAVSDPEGFEWSSDPFGLFAWKRNLVNRNFHGLISEILHFNTVARKQLNADDLPDLSLGQWLDAHGFSQTFRTAYLLPMSAAIWSTPEQLMLDYPVGSFLRFLDNHRLMHAVRPIWRTVTGGSRNYVNAIAHDLGMSARTSAHIQTITPAADGRVRIQERSGSALTFDAVIMACHADASRRMLDPHYEDQRMALGSVRFSANTAWLHRDPSLMPSRRSAWASWNVRKGPADQVCVTYWMNRLQKLPGDKPVFVTLNPVRESAKDKTFGVYEFEHPMYDATSDAGRRSIQRMQGDKGLYFAGAWLGDGFHEAGLRSGLEAAIALGGRVPWTPVLRHHHAAPQIVAAREPLMAVAAQ
jgi:predicted NAD/FAD-binding protein